MWLIQAKEQWGEVIKACIDFLWILDNISTISLLLLENFNLNTQNQAVNHLLPLELRPFCIDISDGIETIKLLCVIHTISNIKTMIL